MGDVVMLLPAVQGLLKANPELKVVLVTRPFFGKFFAGIDRLEVLAPELDGKHKGIWGLRRLARELQKAYQPVAFMDMHAVMRSVVVSFWMRCLGIKVYRISKERKKKMRALKTKDFSVPLKSTFSRYQEPLQQAGFELETLHPPLFNFLQNDVDERQHFYGPDKGYTHAFGIAPFAKHKQKMWPLTQVEKFIELLEENYPCALFFYGGGAEEMAKLKALIGDKENRYLAADLNNIHRELNLMSKLDAMLTMDSGNMHFASMAGTPVFSIWGGTSPVLGFSPYQSPADFQIEPAQDFPCRPCSVFGAKPCIYGDDLPCLYAVSPEQVLQKIMAHIPVA